MHGREQIASEITKRRVALSEALGCPVCGAELRFDGCKRMCCAGEGPELNGRMLTYEPGGQQPPEEMVTRDRQSGNYLEHVKFPVQIDRLDRFLATLNPLPPGQLVLDLGCGPGPTTERLLAKGYRTVSVDFSAESLKVNSQVCGNGDVLFVQSDLNRIRFTPHAASGLMMADFLQHLGGLGEQRSFLQKAFASLKPGGWFYLSVFNTNIKNWLKGDAKGSFAGGTIRYCRLSVKSLRELIPADVAVESVTPMNVFKKPRWDFLATRFPFSSLVSRMLVVTGRKRTEAGGLRC